MGEARKHRLQIMLSAGERTKLQTAADAAGLTLAAHMRTIANLAPPPVRPAAGLIEREAVAALNRVGSHLNQISKAYNSNRSLTQPQVAALGQLFNQIKNLVAKIEAVR